MDGFMNDKSRAIRMNLTLDDMLKDVYKVDL